MIYADGLYALASLDGAPPAADDMAALGLAVDTLDRGFAIVARDRGVATSIGRSYAFLGHVDDHHAVAAALGLDRLTPPAALLLAAIARYGDGAPAQVPGEWSFAHWDAEARVLTLTASDTLRDPLFFATDGHRVAIAPDIRTMRRLDGVGTLDARGVLLSMARAPVRGLITDETILRGVRRVVAGSCVRITSGGVSAGTRQPLPPPLLWRGSFVEAMEALDTLLREIVRAQMARHPRAAVMLSGGLDSSLIATFAAAERGLRGSLVAVTSAALPGSGLLDEVAFSRAVANQAGFPMIPVVPGARADVLQPSRTTLDWMNQPMCSPRHYLYEALHRAAADQGADAIFDGAYGEATVTGYLADASPRQRLRHAVRRTAKWARSRIGETSVQNAFHIRLSDDALENARTELHDALRAPESVDSRRRSEDPWGYSPTISKNARETTASPFPGIRLLLPFRDRRLLTLFAGMPRRFLVEGGVTRAPGRALLAGKVPENIRQRTQGQPFSPDFFERIRRQAAATRDRVPGYRRAGAGDWIDLDWLDGALSGIAAGAPLSLDIAFAVQSTACAAAFLADLSSTPADR